MGWINTMNDARLAFRKTDREEASWCRPDDRHHFLCKSLLVVDQWLGAVKNNRGTAVSTRRVPKRYGRPE